MAGTPPDRSPGAAMTSLCQTSCFPSSRVSFTRSSATPSRKAPSAARAETRTPAARDRRSASPRLPGRARCSAPPRPGSTSPGASTRTVDDSDRDEVGDVAPVPPEVELPEVVRPHDPDEPGSWRASHEPGERVDGGAGADMGLDVRHGDSPAPGEASGGGDARLQRGEVRLGLQRVSRRRQPPDAIEGEPQKGAR